MGPERVVVWIRAADPATAARTLERARRRGFRRLVLAPEPGLAPADGETLWFDRDGRIDRGDGLLPVPIETVDAEARLEAVLGRARPDLPLAIEWTGDRVIPLENAVAARGGRFDLWVVAHGAREVPAALGALEHGANQVLVRVATPEEVDALEATLETPPPTDLAFAEATLVEVAPAGMGDRVLVDTTSLLRPDEGLLVGSAAAFLFLVVSEAAGSAFSRPRPFRVNAGAAHAYVLRPDGATRYLSELRPGDPVLVAGPSGPPRPVRVGRVKIERRPMVMAVADDRGVRRTIFLQEAESVRLGTPAAPIPATELAVGDTVVGVRLAAARHLGRAIDEAIEER